MRFLEPQILRRCGEQVHGDTQIIKQFKPVNIIVVFLLLYHLCYLRNLRTVFFVHRLRRFTQIIKQFKSVNIIGEKRCRESFSSFSHRFPYVLYRTSHTSRGSSDPACRQTIRFIIFTTKLLDGYLLLTDVFCEMNISSFLGYPCPCRSPRVFEEWSNPK